MFKTMNNRLSCALLCSFPFLLPSIRLWCAVCTKYTTQHIWASALITIDSEITAVAMRSHIVFFSSVVDTFITLHYPEIERRSKWN